jgi:anti-sigma regulatory factor (Ser/Thr protein kinase)
MAYTIAQTAGKRATSAWPILMPTDSDQLFPGDQPAQAGYTVPSVQVVSTLHDDPRLLIGAGAIAGHTAHEAGLTEEVQEHLAIATQEACGEVFALAPADRKLPSEVTVTASRFPDRLQITVELSASVTGTEVSSASKKAAAGDGKHGGKLLDERLVDHVQRETRDGRPSIVLVKYYRPVKHKA